MSSEDVTYTRACYIRDVTKRYYEDLREYCSKSKPVPYVDKFNTSRKWQIAREQVLKNPREYYSVHVFSHIIMLDYVSNGQYYRVVVRNIPNFDVTGFDNVSFPMPNCIYIGSVTSWQNAVLLFSRVCAKYFGTSYCFQLDLF